MLFLYTYIFVGVFKLAFIHKKKNIDVEKILTTNANFL